MQIVEENIDLKNTQRVVVEIPKEWVQVIDDACEKSFSPRRTWVVDAIYKKLRDTQLLINKNNDK